ncbi:MAG: head-tail connector protein [Bacteroidota bacterium]
MSYTSVITLASAKEYLGVDDTSRDTEISRMITSALSFLEKRTNIHVKTKDKTYYFMDGCVRVYDFPINTETPTEVESETSELSTLYSTNNSDVKSITLNIGHTDITQIDPDWIEAGYSIIAHLYYGKSLKDVPDTIMDFININKRFIL